MANRQSPKRNLIEGRPALIVIDIQAGTFVAKDVRAIDHMPGYAERMAQARQTIDKAGHFSTHPEVIGNATMTGLNGCQGASLKPIRVGPGLLVYLDQAKRQRFLKQWRRALSGR